MRLLLAEDEKELSNALTVILKHNNYSVDAVYHGEDALTVLRRLREQGNTIPVLILTAKAEVDDRVLGLDCGADDYLTKPFAARELLARLRSITRRRTETLGTNLQFGNLSLDRARYELSSPFGSLRLANKEYQMMEILMSNPGQPISTDRFMEKVWGFNSEADRSVVWVYLSNLRKKLSSLEADVQIKEARNQGYSLEKQL